MLTMSLTSRAANWSLKGSLAARRHHRAARHHARNATPGDDKSLEKIAKELIATDPVTAEKLQRVGDAARRVAELQAEQASLAQQIAENAAQEAAAVREQEAAASATIAAAEVKAANLLLRAAQLQAETAEAQKLQLAEQLQRDADRVESGKAAAAACAAGTLAALPFVLSDAGTGVEAVLTLGGVMLSALLFGVTYRYAVRGDLADTQLKGGVVAAFGLVRGVAQATDALLGTSPPSAAAFLSALPHAALLMGESMLTFAFASAAIELAFQRGLISPLTRGGGSGSGVSVGSGSGSS